MDKKRTTHHHLKKNRLLSLRLLLVILLISMAAAILLLFIKQHFFFTQQSQRLTHLAQHYQKTVESLERIDLASSAFTAQPMAPLIPLNRSMHQLKNSMLTLLAQQQLESLATRVSDDQFFEQKPQLIITQAPKQKSIKKKSIIKKSNPVPTITSNRFFMWPIDRELFWLSSSFGPRKKPNGTWRFHYGLDLAALRGTPIRAAAQGIVEQARYTPGYGNMILINHPNSPYKSKYAHLDTIGVKRGQKVRKGERIGTVGDTGFTIKAGKDASHLHFEVFKHGKQINPITVLT